MLKLLTYAIGMISLFLNSITSMSSCFWFSYEPDLPDKEKQE